MRTLSSDFVKNKDIDIIDGYFFHFNTSELSFFNIMSTSKILTIRAFYGCLTLILYNEFNKKRIAIKNEQYIVFRKKKSIHYRCGVGFHQDNKENTLLFISKNIKKDITRDIENEIDNFFKNRFIEDRTLIIQIDDK